MRAGTAIGLFGIGIGVAAIAYYLMGKDLVHEYVVELRAYWNALERAYSDGKIDDSERHFLLQMQQSLQRKEYVITHTGWVDKLKEAVEALLGIEILAPAGMITGYVIWQLIKRLRPPRPPSFRGRQFSDENSYVNYLRSHMTNNPAPYEALWAALQKAPGWFKAMVANILHWTSDEINRSVEWFDSLPPAEKVAIGAAVAIAVLIIAAFASWLAAAAGVGEVISAAAACVV